MGMDAKFFELDAKMEGLRAKQNSFPGNILKTYQDRLDVSWIFHDNALEGVVLSYSELKAAIDQRIISDVTLIPMYEEVRNHKLAVDFVRDANSGKKPTPIDIELVRKLYALLTPEAAAKAYPFRKENPLHRLYYHEIAPPEKIAYKMKKLDEWMHSEEFLELHPITRATKAHFRLLNIYPWTKNSGKVARLLMNYILIRHGYLPAVIHSIERQRYYEVLRFENEGLLNLVIESLENSIETTAKFLDELNGLRVKRAS
ncbi:MAG: putative Fic family protein [Myxococcales bacterium]|jgi:Fic family protein|nr:putative Fic family protein [Myxococcales bacterium]